MASGSIKKWDLWRLKEDSFVQVHEEKKNSKMGSLLPLLACPSRYYPSAIVLPLKWNDTATDGKVAFRKQTRLIGNL